MSRRRLDEEPAEDVDAILLDIMDVDELYLAVDRIAGRAISEAPGGVASQLAPAIAATGAN